MAENISKPRFLDLDVFGAQQKTLFPYLLIRKPAASLLAQNLGWSFPPKTHLTSNFRKYKLIRQIVSLKN